MAIKPATRLKKLLNKSAKETGGTVEYGLDMIEYHNRAQGLGTVMSSHQLITYNDSPWKFFIDKQIPNVDTPSKRKGRAFHTDVLEPELFDKVYRNGDLGPIHKTGKNAGKKLGVQSQAYKDWVLDLAAVGFTVLPKNDYRDATLMGGHLRESTVKDFFTDGIAEVTFTIIIDGVQFQVRPDYIKLEKNDQGQDILIVPDLKSCRSLDWFVYDATKKYNYIQQVAIYRNVISLVSGFPTDRIYSTLIAVDPAPYYRCGEFLPLASAMNEATCEMNAALHRYKDSLKSNQWPHGYEHKTIIGED